MPVVNNLKFPMTAAIEYTVYSQIQFFYSFELFISGRGIILTKK